MGWVNLSIGRSSVFSKEQDSCIGRSQVQNNSSNKTNNKKKNRNNNTGSHGVVQLRGWMIAKVGEQL